MSWTKASIRAGIWLWMMKLHVASKLGMIWPRPAQSWRHFLEIVVKTSVPTCLIKSTISCSVVSLVMNWSMSVMMSTQMLQVRSFLASGRAEAPRMKRARQRNV